MFLLVIWATKLTKSNWKMCLASSVSLSALRLWETQRLARVSSMDSYVLIILNRLIMQLIRWRGSTWVVSQSMWVIVLRRREVRWDRLRSMVVLLKELLLMLVCSKKVIKQLHRKPAISKKIPFWKINRPNSFSLKCVCMTSRVWRNNTQNLWECRSSDSVCQVMFLRQGLLPHRYHHLQKYLLPYLIKTSDLK